MVKPTSTLVLTADLTFSQNSPTGGRRDGVFTHTWGWEAAVGVWKVDKHADGGMELPAVSGTPAAGVNGGGMRHDRGGGRTRSYTSTCLVSIYLFFPCVFFMIQFPPFVRTLPSPHRPITAALVCLLGGSAFCSGSVCFQSTSCSPVYPCDPPAWTSSLVFPKWVWTSSKQTSLTHYKGS